jgi:2Fe-2S ferredoxin
MANLKFLPDGQEIPAESGTKILVAARKHKIPIRFGCASCRCGTCAVRIEPKQGVVPMEEEERALLNRMGLDLSGDIRLSCRAKVKDSDLIIDLGFQNTYSPDDFEEQDFD